MIIIIKNIPARTTEEQIEEFLGPGLRGGWLSKNGSIESITIKAHQDTWSQTIRYYALIRVNPDSAGTRAIKQLNCKRLNGRNVMVNEYHIRNWHNDRRMNHHQFNEELPNKRKSDRRRRYIEIDNPTETQAAISVDDDFQFFRH